MGREAIQGRMDPRMVSAVAAVRALEEGVILDQEDGDGDQDMSEDEEEGRETKKRRLEIAPAPAPAPAAKAGLLSADTLESLKYFAEIRTKVGGTPGGGGGGGAKGGAKKALEALDYGSDDDE